ncbi:Fibrinogen-like protein A [Holothuria leucospilota]|uniref:Fibrinogen-like protein A n=1 Tax=Holothuria leucospilota TaxID=206669 RepID=A0A9Q1H5G6_HOLLE|nr:Fibrinogen-like protein A [Holothuria leucospilota]
MSHFSHQKLKFIPLSIYLWWWTSWSASSQELNNYQNSGTNSGPSYFLYQQPDYPRDCAEVTKTCSTNNQNGVYLIKPDGYSEPFEAYCDNSVDSGGWTVILRLHDGSIFFDRTWTESKLGFGFLSQDFWLGNEKLSYLTNQNVYELRIDLTSEDGLSFYVKYNRFRISDEFGEYKLTSVGEYSGTEDNITLFLCPPGSVDTSFVLPDCSRRCSCNGSHFSCEDYLCSPNAVCEERNNVLQCYCNAEYTGDGVNCTLDILPSDCQDVYDRVSTESGVYQIKPTTWQRDPFHVYCNMTDGGGWTVFQRRVDGDVDFFLYWSDYRNGFGTPEHELWLGNDKLHSLTQQKNYELRVDLVNSLGDPYYAKYSSFSISDESDNYRLSLGSYTGDAGDSLSYHNGQAFTTRDRDNDLWSGGNCASDLYYYCCGVSTTYDGAWWYNSCFHSSLNSPYGSNCVHWNNLPRSDCNIKYTEMKVRPV